MADWFWIGLGVGAVWLFLKGGMGCGMSGHRAHGTHGVGRSKNVEATQHGSTTNGHATEVGRETKVTTAATRRHRCC